MASKIKVDQIENTDGTGDVAFTGTGGISLSSVKLSTIKSSGGTNAMTIDSSGIVSNSTHVYGIAKYTGSNITASNIIPLNNGTSTGGGVTIVNNEFVVPVAGLYLLIGHHLGGTTGTDGFSIDVNDTEIAKSYSKTSATNSEMNFSIIHLLSANDRVRFYCYNGEIHGNPSYNHMSVYKLG